MLKSLLKIVLTLVVALNFAASTFAQNLVPRMDEKKNLWGYVDSSTGKWVVKPKFETASEYKNQPNGRSRAVVTTKGLTGFIDEKGKLLGAGAVFENITPLDGDAMLVTVKGKTGVANYDGIYMVKPEADAVEQFGDEGWFMTVKGKKGFLGNDGRYLLQSIYEDINTSVPGYFIVNAGGKAGLFKRDGAEVIAPKQYSGIEPYKENIWKVRKGKDEGLVDVNTSAIVLEPKYDSVVGSYLGNKFFIVKKGKNTDIINALGNRRMRYKNYDDIAVAEDAPNGKLILTLDGKVIRIFNQSDANSYKVDVEDESFHDFSRRTLSLAEGEKNDEVAAYLRNTRFFRTPQGVNTPYVDGISLNGKLYAMKDSANKYYLFMDGNTDTLGEMLPNNRDKGIVPADYYELVSGESVNKDGEKVELVKYTTQNYPYYTAVVAMKNTTTGKYQLNGHDLKPFDMVKASRRLRRDRDDQYGILAARDGKIYQMRHNGTVFAESENGALLELENSQTGNYSLIAGPDLKYGLKDSDGKIVLSPEYDDIYMILLYNTDENIYGKSYNSSLFKLYKDGKAALYDARNKKMLIPFEKGYSSLGGRSPEDVLNDHLYDSGLCYVRIGEKDDAETTYGLYNFKLNKEIVAPYKNCEIKELPKGYKGYMKDGVAYTPEGKKLSLPAAVDVYEVEWDNHMPRFYTHLAGLEGRSVKFYITAYESNGKIYRDASGRPGIYEFSKVVTPTMAIQEGPEVAAIVRNEVNLRPFSSIKLKYVLTAKDAKTGASIPVKGDNSITQVWQREW